MASEQGESGVSKIFYCAGDYKQAAYWANQDGLKSKEWSYVTSPDVLKGIYPLKIKFVGEYFKHPEYPEIRLVSDMASARQQKEQK